MRGNRVLSDADLRRSEAAALVWGDVARWDDGSGRLTVGRSNGGGLRRGQEVGHPRQL